MGEVLAPCVMCGVGSHAGSSDVGVGLQASGRAGSGTAGSDMPAPPAQLTCCLVPMACRCWWCRDSVRARLAEGDFVECYMRIPIEVGGWLGGRVDEPRQQQPSDSAGLYWLVLACDIWLAIAGWSGSSGQGLPHPPTHTTTSHLPAPSAAVRAARPQGPVQGGSRRQDPQLHRHRRPL